jgi:ACS family glucarate transporter-like MFS transporter
LATLIAYVHRNSIGVAEMEIRDELGLSMQEMGWVMSAFFLTYALGQLPTASLSQAWGTRKALPIFSILGSIALWLGTRAIDLPALLASRLGLGFAQAGMLPAATNTVRQWLPRSQRALASGVIASSLSIGGAVGSALTGFLLTEWSWRVVFGLYALPGLLWAGWFWLWFRDRPEEHASVNPAELLVIRGLQSADHESPIPGAPEPTPWLAMLASRAMWCICVQQLFRAAGYMFYASWFATFLRETRQVSLEQAGWLTSLPLLGVVLGSVVGGMVSDSVLVRTGSRRLARQGVAVGSLVVSAACILCARGVATPWWAVLLITAGSLTSSFAGPCAYAITIDMGGKHVAPVFSTMNMLGNVGAYFFPLLVPWLVKQDKSWDLVLIVFAGIHLLAAGSWLLLDPRGTVFRKDETEA